VNPGSSGAKGAANNGIAPGANVPMNDGANPNGAAGSPVDPTAPTTTTASPVPNAADSRTTQNENGATTGTNTTNSTTTTNSQPGKTGIRSQTRNHRSGSTSTHNSGAVAPDGAAMTPPPSSTAPAMTTP
jgi:hypothetical protein